MCQRWRNSTYSRSRDERLSAEGGNSSNSQSQATTTRIRTVKYTYDDLNRLLEAQIKWDEMAGSLNIYRYAYDGRGNRRSVRVTGQAAFPVPPPIHEETYTYNDANQVVQRNLTRSAPALGFTLMG